MCFGYGMGPSHPKPRKKVTGDWLARHGACDGGSRWFDKKFPTGAFPEDALAACGKSGWIVWFLKRWPAEDLV